MPSHTANGKLAQQLASAFMCSRKLTKGWHFPVYQVNIRRKHSPYRGYVHLACRACAFCWEQGLLPKECSFHIL